MSVPLICEFGFISVSYFVAARFSELLGVGRSDCRGAETRGVWARTSSRLALPRESRANGSSCGFDGCFLPGESFFGDVFDVCFFIAAMRSDLLRRSGCPSPCFGHRELKKPTDEVTACKRTSRTGREVDVSALVKYENTTEFPAEGCFCELPKESPRYRALSDPLVPPREGKLPLERTLPKWRGLQPGTTTSLAPLSSSVSSDS